MKVDYSSIASRYDLNPTRSQIKADPEIQDSTRTILDVACGTGNYLAQQIAASADRRANWHGIDADEGMLRIARAKTSLACFCQGIAEYLPYADRSFDYITCSYAFHHFTDKTAALVGMRRILVDNGRMKLTNIVPEFSQAWWIYRYFPSTAAIDRNRFWSLDQIRSSLKQLGLSTEISMQALGNVRCDSILGEARNRETSQLLLISDKEYSSGLIRLESDCVGNATEEMDSGLVTCEVKATIASR